MATVIQIPDSVSLLRNLKTFIFSSSSEVTFTLLSSGNTVLSETYFPDSNSRIEIDIQEVASRYLACSLPSGNAYVQSDAVRQFTAQLDGTQVASFTVVLAGVRKLSVTPSSWLAANWLTWQPQSKQVCWNAPEYLSYYFTVSGTVKAKFYRKAGTTKIVTVATGSAGNLVTFNTQFSRLIGLANESANTLYGYIDVWVENGSGTRLSYIQRYVCTDTLGDEHFYLCQNSLGGIDTFTFHGACSLAPEIEHESAMSGTTKRNITSDAERKWQQNTGYAGLTVTKWIFELLASPRAWAVVDGTAEKIVIDTSGMEISDRENLHACTFSFTMAEDGRLISSGRSAAALPSLEVPSPSGELFFLTARLADYPDAELEDTILFLVQSPYTEQWSKASLGAIRQWLTNIIINSSVGLQAHSHENKGVLDNFHELDGKPAYSGEKLQLESDANRKFLRKDVPDRAAGRIGFDDGAEFGQFIPGITGQGGLIDRNGAGELESLVLRRWLEVPELRYNRISIQVGNKWNAPGGGIIEDVSIDTDAAGDPLNTGIITLHLEDGEYGMVAVDDICQGIFHDGMTLSKNSEVDWDDSRGNFLFRGFFTTYFRVTEILDARCQRFRYALRGTSERWPHRMHPCEAMHFVGYGNFTDTTRQTSRYSTRTYERYLKNVNDWEITASMIAAQFGDLTNLSIHGMQMAGYSAYLNNIYMSGTIAQFDQLDLRMEIDTEGDTFLAWGESLHVTCHVWRGFYEEVTDQIVSWSIVRDSGDAVDDAAWSLKQKVQNFAGEIDICFTQAENDLGGNANTVSTLFTIRASLLNDDQVEANIVI